MQHLANAYLTNKMRAPEERKKLEKRSMAESAESLERLIAMNKLDIFGELVETLDKTEELNEDKRILSECCMVKTLNDDTDKMIEALTIVKSALQNMMDLRNAVSKRLKNTIMPNAFLLEYEMHEDFLKYCREVPLVLSFLKAKNNLGFVMELDDDHKLISSMEREVKWQKSFISSIKRLTSDLEEYDTYFSKLTEFLKKNEDEALTD